MLAEGLVFKSPLSLSLSCLCVCPVLVSDEDEEQDRITVRSNEELHAMIAFVSFRPFVGVFGSGGKCASHAR